MVKDRMSVFEAQNSYFEIVEPLTQRIPFVFNSPHSGRNYPASFLEQSRLDAHTLRRSEDYYADELFAAGALLGAPLLKAHFPRAYVDVNREPYELDARMFEGSIPPYANRNSARVAGGLGTIPRLVAENMDIYNGKLPIDEAIWRIETIYKPYHATLRKLIAATHVHFGQAVLIDCHSMPGNIRVGGTGQRPDIIVGDRHGTSAAPHIALAAVEILEGLGFSVARNKPYAGGFITEHYGRPARSLHALQIEVSRALYIDETTLEKKPDFHILAEMLGEFLARLVAHVGAESRTDSLAAE
ncbi:N-formylglutamate amidohydrolase [Rhizobium sp. L1K21]|uniref:N-formylglutamate amidohydrolase n=1 Tax=Rhizobium sp. L1K21 TaxID=2954933 RepID=UPI0035936A3D